MRVGRDGEGQLGDGADGERARRDVRGRHSDGLAALIRRVGEVFRQAAADLRAAEIERSGSEEEASVVADTVQVDPSGLQLGIAHVERDLPDVVTGSLRQELDAHRHAAAGWNGAPRRLHQARPAELGSTRDDVRLAEDAVLGTGIEQLETLRRRMEDVLQPEIKGGRRVDGHLARPQDPSQRGERNLDRRTQPVVRFDHKGPAHAARLLGREVDGHDALRARSAHGPRRRRSAERPHRRIALQRDPLHDERGGAGGIEADIGDDELLRARRSDGSGLQIEWVGSRIDHRPVTEADEVEVARRALRRDEAGVPFLRTEVRRRETRRAGNLLASRERQRERRVPVELDGIVARGDRERGQRERPLAGVARRERRFFRQAEPHQAEVDARRLRVQKRDDAVTGQHERKRAARRAGRHLHRRLRRTEMRRREVHAHARRRFRRHCDETLLRCLERRAVRALRRVDADVGTRVAVVVRDVELERDRLPEHRVAEIERLRRELRQTTHGVPLHVDVLA